MATVVRIASQVSEGSVDTRQSYETYSSPFNYFNIDTGEYINRYEHLHLYSGTGYDINNPLVQKLNEVPAPTPPTPPSFTAESGSEPEPPPKVLSSSQKDKSDFLKFKFNINMVDIYWQRFVTYINNAPSSINLTDAGFTNEEIFHLQNCNIISSVPPVFTITNVNALRNYMAIRIFVIFTLLLAYDKIHDVTEDRGFTKDNTSGTKKTDNNHYREKVALQILEYYRHKIENCPILLDSKILENNYYESIIQIEDYAPKYLKDDRDIKTKTTKTSASCTTFLSAKIPYTQEYKLNKNTFKIYQYIDPTSATSATGATPSDLRHYSPGVFLFNVLNESFLYDKLYSKIFELKRILTTKVYNGSILPSSVAGVFAKKPDDGRNVSSTTKYVYAEDMIKKLGICKKTYNQIKSLVKISNCDFSSNTFNELIAITKNLRPKPPVQQQVENDIDPQQPVQQQQGELSRYTSMVESQINDKDPQPQPQKTYNQKLLLVPEANSSKWSLSSLIHKLCISAEDKNKILYLDSLEGIYDSASGNLLKNMYNKLLLQKCKLQNFVSYYQVFNSTIDMEIRVNDKLEKKLLADIINEDEVILGNPSFVLYNKHEYTIVFDSVTYLVLEYSNTKEKDKIKIAVNTESPLPPSGSAANFKDRKRYPKESADIELSITLFDYNLCSPYYKIFYDLMTTAANNYLKFSYLNNYYLLITSIGVNFAEMLRDTSSGLQNVLPDMSSEVLTNMSTDVLNKINLIIRDFNSNIEEMITHIKNANDYVKRNESPNPPATLTPPTSLLLMIPPATYINLKGQKSVSTVCNKYAVPFLDLFNYDTNLFTDNVNININLSILNTQIFSKTAGDLGQMLAAFVKFFSGEYFEVFVTFDQICSYIASVFLFLTIYETSDSNPLNPLNYLMSNNTYNNAIDVLKSREDYAAKEFVSVSVSVSDDPEKAVDEALKILSEKSVENVLLTLATAAEEVSKSEDSANLTATQMLANTIKDGLSLDDLELLQDDPSWIHVELIINNKINKDDLSYINSLLDKIKDENRLFELALLLYKDSLSEAVEIASRLLEFEGDTDITFEKIFDKLKYYKELANDYNECNDDNDDEKCMNSSLYFRKLALIYHDECKSRRETNTPVIVDEDAENAPAEYEHEEFEEDKEGKETIAKKNESVRKKLKRFHSDSRATDEQNECKDSFEFLEILEGFVIYSTDKCRNILLNHLQYIRECLAECHPDKYDEFYYNPTILLDNFEKIPVAEYLQIRHIYQEDNQEDNQEDRKSVRKKKMLKVNGLHLNEDYLAYLDNLQEQKLQEQKLQEQKLQEQKLQETKKRKVMTGGGSPKNKTAIISITHTLIRPVNLDKAFKRHAKYDLYAPNVLETLKTYSDTHQIIFIGHYDSKETQKAITNFLETIKIPYTALLTESSPDETLISEQLPNIDLENSIVIGDKSMETYASKLNIPYMNCDDLFYPVVPASEQSSLIKASPRKEIVMLVGYPGSGKSTLTQKFMDAGYLIIDWDVLRDHTKMYNKMMSAVDKGMSVVLDATFVTKKMRNSFVEFAKDSEVPMRCVILTTPVFEAYVRNTRRAAETGAKRTKIPLRVYQDMQNKFEEPTLEEGFIKILHYPKVTAAATGGRRRKVANVSKNN